jgi:hypothetical protein
MVSNLFELETRWKSVPIDARFAIGTLPEPAILVNFNCSQEELANLCIKHNKVNLICKH